MNRSRDNKKLIECCNSFCKNTVYVEDNFEFSIIACHGDFYLNNPVFCEECSVGYKEDVNLIEIINSITRNNKDELK